HAYTMVLVDIIARYKKSQGYQVYFQTGSDEHGEKIEKKAKSLGISPQDEGKVINNNLCPAPNCQTELRKVDEPAYFLRVSKYYPKLLKFYSQNPNFLLPANIKKELFENFLKNDIQANETPLEAAKREVFEETNLVIEDLEIVEKETIGKIKFLGISEVQEINSQDRDEGKMSKSKGNVIDPLELLKKYPSDLLRTYFVAKINFLQDGVCDEDLLKEFYQDFLVNNLSNLVSRVNKMLQLYREGIIPSLEKEPKNEKLTEYKKKCEFTVKEFQKKMDQYELTNAFSQIKTLLDETNKLISDLAP
ncbi:17848_t:CDS:2, partial [Funneliformis geosporum]